MGQQRTFGFSLDLKKASGPRPAPGGRADLAGLHVLIVDDNETNRLVLEGYLRAWHMTSVSTHGGDQALTRWQEATASGRPFDAAILDLNMPGTDGITLAREVRSRGDGATARLILLTSSAQPGETEAAMSAGIDAYLTKPIRRSQLFDCLANVMGLAPDPDNDPCETVPQPDMGSGHILVVEDNKVNQMVACRMVQSLGYTVDVVNNGEEALAAVIATEYAAVLMDCQMPIMDGYRATEEIRRQEPRGRRTPVIALTAGAMDGDGQLCLDAGMDDYITKPVSRRALGDTLTRWVPGSDNESRKRLTAPP